MRVVAATLLLLGLGCEPEATDVRDAAGRYELTLIGRPMNVDEEDGKQLWDLGAVHVTTQRLERTPYNEDVSLGGIADALVTRFDEGDVEGDLVHRTCELGDGRAACLRGHSVHDGARIERRGFVFEDGDDLVWVEVLARTGHETEAERQFQRIQETFRWLS